MEPHYFWAFFVIALLVGAGLALAYVSYVNTQVTAQVINWPWLKKSQKIEKESEILVWGNGNEEGTECTPLEPPAYFRIVGKDLQRPGPIDFFIELYIPHTSLNSNFLEVSLEPAAGGAFWHPVKVGCLGEGSDNLTCEYISDVSHDTIIKAAYFEEELNKTFCASKEVIVLDGLTVEDLNNANIRHVVVFGRTDCDKVCSSIGEMCILAQKASGELINCNQPVFGSNSTGTSLTCVCIRKR